MDSRRVAATGSRSGSKNTESLNNIVYRKMVFLVSFCWSLLSATLIFLFSFIARHVFRTNKQDRSRGGDYEVLAMKDLRSPEPKHEVTKFEDGSEEKEATSFSFKFEHQISKDHVGNFEGPEIPAVIKANESPMTADIRKYRFLSEKDFNGYIEAPLAKTFHVQESYVDSSTDCLYGKGKSDTKFVGSFLLEKDYQQPGVEIANDDSLSVAKKLDELKDEILLKSMGQEKERHIDSETKLSHRKEHPKRAIFFSEVFSGFDSDSESVSLSDGYSVKDLVVDSDSDGFLSERDFDGHEHESSSMYESELMQGSRKLEEAGLHTSLNSDAESANSTSLLSHTRNQSTSSNVDIGETWSADESSNPESELPILNEEEVTPTRAGEFKETELPSSDALHIEFTDSSDDELNSVVNDIRKMQSIHEDVDEKDMEYDTSANNSSRSVLDSEQDDEETQQLERELDELLKNSDQDGREQEQGTEKSERNHSDDLDDDEYDELESLWEHQDLVEQLKMELKKARAFGLPTILEESESPKTVEDLKPWKFDEKFLHEDPMDELHKFYKSYRERMRKFDILNYQKMYAIGFLQLKDPLQSMGTQKPLIPNITAILSQSFRICRRKTGINPSENFIKELRTDLETVYVAQACLSWEFLRWQYEKARELPESDPYRHRQYNQVAGEFQQFQVIIQRFIENESFQGPRLQNYVKNRCVLRNLLQVPVIKEDNLKDKMEEQRKGNDAITSEMLEDIMEESIRIFWEFVKADKDETPVILKGFMGTQVELQDPSDIQLMMDIQAALQKKEKKLKDILRTGNCLVKKFKKPKEDRSNQDLFFSQVDMKLISRVLKMSRITTDQLVWCHKKLSKIIFIERKIHREPAFLLFPC